MKNGIFLLLFFPMFLFSQEKAKFKEKLEGTYQIEFLKTATDPIAVTGEVLEKIEANRKEDQVSYLIMNDQCRIKIFPKKALATSKREALEEFIVVEKFDN